MSVRFVTLISRDHRPLYIQSFDAAPNPSEKLAGEPSIEATETSLSSQPLEPAEAERFLQYNFLSHMIVDIFASPGLSLREKQIEDGGPMFLLYEDDINVYALETNNGLKIAVGVSHKSAARQRLQSLFSQIHKAYLKTICNPFIDLSTSKGQESLLHTKSFDQLMNGLVRAWEKEK